MFFLYNKKLNWKILFKKNMFLFATVKNLYLSFMKYLLSNFF